MGFNWICNRRSDQQNHTIAQRQSDMLVTSMITERIGQHDNLSLMNQKFTKFQKRNTYLLSTSQMKRQNMTDFIYEKMNPVVYHVHFWAQLYKGRITLSNG